MVVPPVANDAIREFHFTLNHCSLGHVAVQSLAALDRGSPLMRSAIRRTSPGKSAFGTSVNGASGTSPTQAVR
jgi:hypothetical protein